jgi:hypothetical protein
MRNIHIPAQVMMIADCPLVLMKAPSRHSYLPGFYLLGVYIVKQQSPAVFKLQHFRLFPVENVSWLQEKWAGAS